MDDSGDQDMYVSQLKEVFDSCDAGGLGMLNRVELEELCSKLQLEDQAEELLRYLVGDSTKTLVNFDTFKEGFVMVLSSAVDLDNIEGLSDADDNASVGSINEVSIAEELEVSPKYVKGNKKYGRRSRPDFDLSYTADYSDIETDFSSHFGGNDTSRGGKEERGSERSRRSDRSWKASKSLSFADDISESFDDNGNKDSVFDHEEKTAGSSASKRDIPTIVHETFEAEGQMNASMSLMEAAPTEADQVQAIWDEVGVGQDGFLDIRELATVCQHIGMEDMDEEELNNLFNKLDVDQDGKVGFQEFLEGLFRHEGPRPPTTPLPSALSTAQKAKLRMSMMGSSMDDPIYRTATPSFLLVPGTKLLSMLDPNNTGYAGPDDIVEQFATQGVQNPVEVLQNLDIDTASGKVSLSDLSTALEHVLMTTGDTNGIYQAALTSYQAELTHLKSQLDALTDERNKLRADTNEANQRNAMLVKEVDETHANIIKTNEAKLQAAERKHQEKLVAMQAEIEKERQQMATQAAKQRQRLEDEINQIKSGDAGMRERFAEMQKEITRLEQELTEAAEKLIDNEKTIQKQQRDLDGFQELEERLAELESNRETVSKQQEEYFEQNLKEYQEHVRVLQDQLDELTQENELLKHQTSERKIRRRGSKLQHSNKPSRVGSVLSDYTKPAVIKRSSGHSSSENESELEELDPQSKRRLPLTARSGGDGNSNEEEDSQRAKLEAEIELLKEKHSKELAESRTAFERDCKDLEFRYKMEITDLEDGFERQKEEMQEEFQREQRQLIEEVERRFSGEKQEMAQQFAREKQELEEFFSKETTELRDRLEAEYNVEMDNRIAEVKQKLLDEKASVEKELSQEKSSLSEEVIRERNAAEVRLKKLQSELELRFLEEKGEMQAQWERERTELELMYQEKVHELEMLFVDGEVGLKGQLRRDFDQLLAQHRAEIEHGFEREKEALLEELEMEKADLLKVSKGDKASLLQKAKEERSELLKRHKKETLELAERHKKLVTDLEDRREREKAEMEERMRRERQRAKQEREKLESRFRQELSKMEMSLTVSKDELERSVHEEVEDKLRTEIRREMEKELMEQMEQFKRGYNEEKTELIYQKEELESKLQQAEVAAQEAVSVVTMHTLQATQKEAEADKAQLMLVTDEKENLAKDLSDVNRRLLEAQMQLSIQDTQHLRELQRLRDKHTEASAKELQALREDLIRKDARLAELERTVGDKEEEVGRRSARAREESQEEVRRLQEAKAELERKQKKMRAMLDEYVRKLKDQLTRSTRSDIMVKELYLENCKLQTALQVTEERQKNAERACHNLTEKNQVYLRLIRKVSPAVL
ncbi:ninein-like protein isoform X2 [Acanthaster planci]|uniref:Ninein-like protein isoform X2 n=1 Tax=Acanthaster planci TaxID=133434 RepID=A0A8B7YN49_ACAPL|nr:ninein-like protein isoform X2 [Acanthaster planci]